MAGRTTTVFAQIAARFGRSRRRRAEALAREQRRAAAAELSEALARLDDREEAGRVLLDTLNEKTGNEFSGLIIVDEDGEEAHGLVARSGGADVSWYPSIRLDLKNEVSGIRKAYEDRAPLLADDTSASPHVHKALVEKTGMKSAAFMPLVAGGRVIAVVGTGSINKARPLTPEGLDLAKMLLAEGAAALERLDTLAALESALERERKLLDENRERLAQQEELLAATEVLTSELELDSLLSKRLAQGRRRLSGALNAQDVMSETTRQAVALFEADASLLLELVGSDLVVRAGAGEDVEELIGRRFPLAISLAGDIVNSRRSLVIGDLGWDAANLDSLDPVAPPGFQALMGVPVVGIREALEGVLFVYSREPRPWREKETDTLESLAANTAAALANADLYLRVSLDREQSIAILSSVADGIVAVDRRGKIVLWNAAAERITGVASDEALGRTSIEILKQELGSRGGPAERAISIRRGGRELWLMVTESIMRDPADQIAGRIYTLRDVSNDHIVEQAKSVFVSSVSHELRAPLTSIYGFAETLLRRGELFDEAQRRTFIAYIASESERLTGIVDTLLDVAELDTGDLEVELAETDVARVVREVVESARTGETGGGNGHEFVIDLEDETLSAEVDREKLRRVLGNLVDNAVKFSPVGGTVTVTGRRKRPGVVELRVVDEGAGIPEEEREHIFRKFYRGSSSSLSGGTGLGLFITRGLITAMGGRIWVDSAEGEGSTFVLELVSAGDGRKE